MSSLIETRSRERVKDLGEVFTPEAYVDDMLEILSQDKRGFWSDENIVDCTPKTGEFFLKVL